MNPIWLTDSTGEKFWVNPAQLVCVGAHKSKTHTWIQLAVAADSVALCVESVEEVADLWADAIRGK